MMKQVLDKHHQPIKGLFRGETGALVVKDDNKFQSKLAEHDRVVRIQNQVDSLNTEVKSLKQMIQLLIDKHGYTS